jgi:hypothetical protein
MSDPERDSSESTWQTLAPPPVVPMSDVEDYQAPDTNAPDPRSLRLTPLAWLPWAAGATLLSGLFIWYLVADTWWDARALLCAAIFLMLSGWAWRQLLFAPRLTLDSEGLRFSTYGPRHHDVSLIWSEIEALYLEGSSTKLGDQLTLGVTLRSDSTHASKRKNRDHKLDLGMAGFKKVDRILRQYCRCEYASSRW